MFISDSKQHQPPANGGIKAISSPDFRVESSSVVERYPEAVMHNFGIIVLNP